MPPPKRNELPRPFLKWAGGKTQLLPQLEALFPPPGEVKRYLEPFVGSGAVFFHLHNLQRPREIVLADSNAELIETYRAIQDDVEAVIRRLRRHRQAHAKEHYYRVRALDTARLSASARAARTIYLNKTCFNGLYRVNSRGGFNVPLGRYKSPPILDASNLRAAASALRDVELKVAHFRETPAYARAGDFIYFDPPYQPLSPTASFTAYTRGSFGARDQEELAEVFRSLAAMHCRVMLSNSDTELIHRLYRDFEIRKVDARRSINSNASRRGAILEVVVCSFAPARVLQETHRTLDKPPDRRPSTARLRALP